MTVFLFPGQGSQKVGMGHALAGQSAAARAVFDEIDAALGEKLSDTIFNGPADVLTQTANAQPALFAVAMAIYAELKAQYPAVLENVAFLAGHSLGEYCALAAAGALGIADGARLLRLRGEAMQAAVADGEGAMYAIVDMEAVRVNQILEEARPALEDDELPDQICELANDNAPGQVVISGHAGMTGRMAERICGLGAKRAVALKVSAPFHCRLMAPAATRMASALRQVQLADLQRPVVANVSARPVSEAGQIRDVLEAQITGTVRWRESIDWMVAGGATGFVEIGAGKVLTNLLRRYWPGLEARNTQTMEDIAGLTAWLAGRGKQNVQT